MVKTKRILIALAVIGTNMLYNMPVYTSLAAEPDYTITHGTTLVDSPYSDSHTYSSVVIGNTGVLDGILSDIDMVIRSGTYNASSVEGCVQMVGSNVAGANISNNHLTINNATINTLYGAHYKYNDYPSVNGTLENNSITIHNGFYRNVYTAYAYYGNLTGNILTVEGGTFQQYMNEYIAAGYVQSSGNVLSNRFIINGGTFKKYKSIYGGYVASGNAIGNVVTINNGAFSDTDGWINVYGGFGQGGYLVDNGNVTKNKVDIKGGSFDIACSIYGGYLNGSSLHGSISENEVNVSGGTFNVKMSFCGGSLPRSDLNAVSIEKNKVTIKNVTLANGSEIYGGQSSKVKIDSNNVTIDSGTFNNVVIVGGKSETADVLNNSVILKGGNFAGGTKIIAGIGVSDSAKFSGNSISLAGSNAIDLSGASLMGYDTTGFANSTLNVGRANVKVKDIKNFGTIAFDLTGVSSDSVVLKMQNTLNLSSWNVANITVSGITLDDDDYITLMQNVSGSYTGTNVKVLEIGTGTDIYELVYYGSGTAPTTAKGDYTIKQGGVKGESGTAGSYTSTIKGNTDGAELTVTGGSLSSTSYSGNEIIIRRGTYDSPTAVAGAYNTTNDAISNNTVKIYDGTLKGIIYGGYSSSSGAVSGNKVNIYGGTLGEGNTINIYGGWSNGSNATGNLTNIEGGTFASGTYIRGGGSNSGNAIGNTLIIKGGTFSGASNNFYGGESNNGNAGGNSKEEGNTLNIIGGTFGDSSNFYGGKSSFGKALYNSVNVEGGTFDNSSAIYGGYVNSSGNANYNKITINAGTFNNNNIGNWSESGNSDKNTVIINDGNFEGYSSNYGIWGGLSNSGSDTSTNENKIYINGGTFGDNISFWGAYGSSGEAKDNIVEIAGGTFGNNFGLYGGYTGGASTNNTLNLKIKMGGKANEVSHFQNMNFTLPSNITNGDIMLETASVTYDNTTIGVTAANGVKLNKDDVIYLVKADDINSTTIANDEESVLNGAAIVKLDGNDLILTLLQDFEQKKTAGNEDQQKAPVEGIAAAMQTVNMSADLASGQGMASLIAETAGGVTNTFGALTTGQSKYKTGSHVDIDGWGMLVGAGKTKEWGNGEATSLGVFFEYGKGDFDTYNGNVHGDGNSKNQGIGIMMRHKMLNNTYYEGNIRYGKQSTEWSESEIGSYDTDSRYYGISIGMGHIYQAGKNEIDVYGRYTYGHVGACDVTVGDSHYNFESVKSHRVRIGGKYNFKLKDSNAKPFIGLAWEHEFKGESKASISGVGEAPAPSMKGHTGIMEVGCDWKVSKKWTLGLGANAYIGKRKGWDGMARVFYNF